MKSQKQNTIQLHEKDNIAVVVETLQPCDTNSIESIKITISYSLVEGYKLTLRDIN